MARQVIRAGYYWLTLESDCIKYAQKCHKCQIYADKIHMSPTELYVMAPPWPFSMWGMDVIGPITPKASNGHRFIFGRYGAKLWCLILNCSQICSIILLFKLVALFEMILFGIPYRHMIQISGVIHWSSNTGIWCRFYPFCEIIDNHKDESMSIRSFWGNWSNDVHAPHRERPGWCHDM